MAKKLVTKLSLLILSFLLAVWGFFSGCDSKKDDVQPLYGVDSVSVKK